MDNMEALRKQLARKTQECEELKETIQIQNKMQMEVCEEKNTEFDQLEVNKKQAEQKLEKIRQVCAETKDVGENIKDMYTAKLSGLYLKSRQILQIIDEVE